MRSHHLAIVAVRQDIRVDVWLWISLTRSDEYGNGAGPRREGAVLPQRGATITTERMFWIGGAVPEWLIDQPTGALGFPRLRYRHPNGGLVADRERNPTVHQPLGQPRRETWTYICACGEVFEWERNAAS